MEGASGEDGLALGAAKDNWASAPCLWALNNMQQDVGWPECRVPLVHAELESAYVPAVAEKEGAMVILWLSHAALTEPSRDLQFFSRVHSTFLGPSLRPSLLATCLSPSYSPDHLKIHRKHICAGRALESPERLLK